MLIFENTLENRLPFEDGCALALGFFDGVHIAHKTLIEKCADVARQSGLKSAVHTFYSLPKGDGALTSFEQKSQIIKDLGVDVLAVDSFSKDMKDMAPEEFIDKVVVRALKAHAVVVGYDYAFGRGASGNVEILKEILEKRGAALHVVGEIKMDGVSVSSGEIKRRLKSGDVEGANALLGRNFEMAGRVLKGRRVGTKLSAPTANLKIEESAFCPAYGVYVCMAGVGGESYGAVTNIGVRPTFDLCGAPVCETNIFGLDKDIYGELLRVEFLHMLRVEMKFDGEKELKNAIQTDIIKAREYFASSEII